MNRSTLAALVVALMLGSGVAGYLVGRPGELDRSHARRSVRLQHLLNRPTPRRPATGPQSAAPVPIAQPKPAPNEAFAYRRFGIDSSHPDAEACLFFNKPLETGDGVKYGDYVRITPEVKSAVRAVDDKLCIGGLGYGQDYSVRLLAGLAAKDGSKLAGEQKVDVALGARPAVVALPGKGFILPRGEAVGLPITTINVGQVGIAVYRVNERGIDRFISDYSYENDFPASKPFTEIVDAAAVARRRQGHAAVARHDGRAQRAEPVRDDRLSDPRHGQGLEARRLLRRGLERRPASRQE